VFSSRGVEVVDVLKADGPGCLVVYSIVGVEQPRTTMTKFSRLLGEHGIKGGARTELLDCVKRRAAAAEEGAAVAAKVKDEDEWGRSIYMHALAQVM